ncbi:MAG: sugar ABC transporter permease [Eubacteriales bacterium]|nr:sugar ABC transporter permease [Eubacteriales bacterium]
MNVNRELKTSIGRKKVIPLLRRNISGWALLLPTVYALALCKWYPQIYGFVLSFFKTKGYTPMEFVGFLNYINVVTDTLFLHTLWNSLTYVLLSFVVGFIPPIILAILLNEVIHWNKLFRISSYIPYVSPFLAVSIIWANIYHPSSGGLLNMFLGKFGIGPHVWLLDSRLTILLIIISMTWNGCPGTAIIYLAALKSISQEWYESATIDGAGVWRKFMHITLPSISPVLLLMAVKQVIAVFQVMEQPLVMTGGGPNNASTTLNLTIYDMAFKYMQVDRSLALGVVSFLILVIITVGYFYLQNRIEE